MPKLQAPRPFKFNESEKMHSLITAFHSRAKRNGTNSQKSTTCFSHLDRRALVRKILNYCKEMFFDKFQETTNIYIFSY